MSSRPRRYPHMVAVRFDDATIAAVDAVAARTRVTRAELLRSWIENQVRLLGELPPVDGPVAPHVEQRIRELVAQEAAASLPRITAQVAAWMKERADRG